MAHVLHIAAYATRTAQRGDLLRSMIVGGCALALILARAPIGI
jgi:hypothetical protein